MSTKAVDGLKNIIIYTADQYIQDHDEMTEEHIMLIDDFADALLTNLETLTQKEN